MVIAGARPETGSTADSPRSAEEGQDGAAL